MRMRMGIGIGSLCRCYLPNLIDWFSFVRLAQLEVMMLEATLPLFPISSLLLPLSYKVCFGGKSGRVCGQKECIGH